MTKLFIRNLPFDLGEPALLEIFAAYGEVERLHIGRNRDTGLSRGFAFVEMPNDSEAQTALACLNGAEIGGRTIKISPAYETARHD